MNWLGLAVFVLLLMVAAAAVVYVALFRNKKEKEAHAVNPAPVEPKPADPCVDCAPAPTTLEKSVKVSLKANNPPEVPAGVFCTRTLSIQAVEDIVGCQDCVVIREWFDNGVLRETGTTTLTGFFGTKHKIKFGTKHKIKYRLTVGSTIIEREAAIT